jgi:hypothetical protein
MKDRRHSLNGYLSSLEKKYEDFRIEYACKLSESSPQLIRDYILGKKLAKTPSVENYIDFYFSTGVQNLNFT